MLNILLNKIKWKDLSVLYSVKYIFHDTFIDQKVRYGPLGPKLHRQLRAV